MRDLLKIVGSVDIVKFISKKNQKHFKRDRDNVKDMKKVSSTSFILRQLLYSSFHTANAKPIFALLKTTAQGLIRVLAFKYLNT